MAQSSKNVTLRFDESILRQARRIAVDDDKSLSSWVSELVRDAVMRRNHFVAARRRAVRRLKRGLDLGGRPLSRDELHER